MGNIYNGSGATVSYNSTALDPISFSFGGIGGTRQTYDVTKLSNVDVKTKMVGALLESNDIVVTIEHDPSVEDALWGTSTDGNAAIVITAKDGATTKTATIYGSLTGISEPTLTEDARATVDCTFTITNLNGGTETGPAVA